MKSRFIILLMAALIVAAPAETSARKKKAKEEDSKETVAPLTKNFSRTARASVQKVGSKPIKPMVVQFEKTDTSVRHVVLPEDVMLESIRYVTAHEIGHCLGLMHNMAASSAFPVDSLRSATFTARYGTTPSIMDYARYNYVAQPEDKGVKLTPPVLGEYDMFAIKWLYTPLFTSP